MRPPTANHWWFGRVPIIRACREDDCYYTPPAFESKFVSSLVLILQVVQCCLCMTLHPQCSPWTHIIDITHGLFHKNRQTMTASPKCPLNYGNLGHGLWVDQNDINTSGKIIKIQSDPRAPCIDHSIRYKSSLC